MIVTGISVLTYLLKGEKTSEWCGGGSQSGKVSVCDAGWERFQHVHMRKGGSQ